LFLFDVIGGDSLIVKRESYVRCIASEYYQLRKVFQPFT